MAFYMQVTPEIQMLTQKCVETSTIDLDLYDKNDVPVGYYTESIYVVSGELSKPEIFIKNEDGSVKTDSAGKPVKDDSETASVEVEPNLFPATVTAEKDKKVYAETTVKDGNGTIKQLFTNFLTKTATVFMIRFFLLVITTLKLVNRMELLKLQKKLTTQILM